MGVVWVRHARAGPRHDLGMRRGVVPNTTAKKAAAAVTAL